MEVDNNTSDSDLDSLADLADTPTKSQTNKQRTLPARLSRAVPKYYADEDFNAGELEESDDEYNPFKLRQEEEKKEARKQRVRQYADNYDSD